MTSKSVQKRVEAQSGGRVRFLSAYDVGFAVKVLEMEAQEYGDGPDYDRLMHIIDVLETATRIEVTE
jgi:hypothetical protein